MALFNNLIKRASKFVEKQKGVWDHSKWQGFLSDAQKKGVDMTEEKRKYLGSVMESMKKFYESSSETGKKMTGTVSDQAAKFVDKTKGKWEHLEWEKFVKDIQQKGVDITEDTKANLGGILESAKKFYVSLSPAMKKEKKGSEIIEKPEDIIAPKVSKTTTSKKKRITLKKKPAKKVASKKAKESKVTKTVKTVSPKRKTAKKPAVKKPTVARKLSKPKAPKEEKITPKKKPVKKVTSKKAKETKVAKTVKKVSSKKKTAKGSTG